MMADNEKPGQRSTFMQKPFSDDSLEPKKPDGVPSIDNSFKQEDKPRET